MTSQVRSALVLQGGGALGAYELGAMLLVGMAQAWLVLARRAEQNASAEILLETTSAPLAATAA